MDKDFKELIALLDEHHDFIGKLMNIYDEDFPTVVAEIFKTGITVEKGIVAIMEDDLDDNEVGE